VSEEKTLILIVEDDLDIADMLTAYFGAQGYDAYAVNWGEQAIKFCSTNVPDLIILDIRLPDIDGYEVARRLRAARRTKETPIIFLTERRSRTDRLYGLELGADDYITKPFDVQELRLRVRNSLKRQEGGTLTNPVTGLPEGRLVDERLSECLGKDGWALLLVSIDHLQDFREAYGFVASDDVLRAISLMIQNALRDLGGTGDFVGQFAPTSFILVTVPLILPDLAQRIRSRLDQSLDYFYPLKDRGRDDVYGKRLAVHINQLPASQGPFNDLDHLKSQLAASRVKA
jgi:PleD family two-component response regulator